MDIDQINSDNKFLIGVVLLATTCQVKASEKLGRKLGCDMINYILLIVILGLDVIIPFKTCSSILNFRYIVSIFKQNQISTFKLQCLN